MQTLENIQARYGRNLCRYCINSIYHTRLMPNDCRYGDPYPARCPRCGEMRNIVTGLRLRGKLKLLMKKDADAAPPEEP